jgi:hypothetical protein
MSHFWGWFLIAWGFFLILFMAVGGFFMFRKFLKVLPKKDGKSTLDWQNHWVDSSRHLWTEETKALLKKLVLPVPKPFRDIAQHTIAARIGQLALERSATHITPQLCIEGYILATPKRDHRYMRAFLAKEGIDIAPYEHLF